MGKASKKLKRRNQQQKHMAANQKGKQQEQKMDAYLSQGEYAEALESLAGMIEAGDIQADYLYKGAYCYFMQGDYEKAAQWVSNTLYYEPNHLDARILLARICLLEDRESDALAVLERVLAHGASDLTEKQKNAITSMTSWDSLAIDKNLFPQTAAFLQQDLPTEEKAAEEEEDILTSLKKLKAKLMNKAGAEETDAAEASAPTEPESEEAETAVPAPSSDASAAEQRIEEIIAQPVSLREKIQLLNRFAGAAFIAKDWETAYGMLKAALQMDDKDAVSLRNMAMLLAMQGDKEKALEVAASLPETDFVLLHQIVRV